MDPRYCRNKDMHRDQDLIKSLEWSLKFVDQLHGNGIDGGMLIIDSVSKINISMTELKFFAH